ncbi:argonaute-like protein [Mycena maculata]|uniref:Argonaute-like protein n=1 Tax=Mycena maculata TaxID=230809 RepID=A0AAD7J7Q8_9AGAR|nr:argonaute-like protein [Mycena maculata]
MAGTPVSVITNSFLIQTLPTKTYFQYDIFSSEEKLPNPAKRQRLIHALQTSAYPTVFSPRVVYDGGRLLYSSHAIRDGAFRVHGSNQSAPPDAPGWYNIRIARTAGKDVHPIHVAQLMKGQVNDESLTAANLVQLLLCQAANLRHPNTGRAYFNPEGKQTINGMAVELWRGFFQAVRPTVSRILVTVDVTVAAMYMPGPLIDVALAVLNARDPRRLAIRDERSDDFKRLERHFKKRLIMVKTSGNRTKTVHGLVPGPVGQYEFQPGSGSATTVGAHYQAAHNIRLAFPDTIGVVTSGRGAPFKVVIPIELCTMLPGQLYKKKLPPDATATVVGFAAMRPADRLRTIRRGTSTSAARPGELLSPVQEYANSEFMVEAGMLVDQNTISISGRMLPVPSLIYNNRKQVSPRDGGWNVVGSRLYAPQNMLKWAVVNFDPHHIPQQVLQGAARNLAHCCQELGMRVEQPRSVRSGSGHDVQRVIAQVVGDFGGHAADIDMILVFLPSKADDIRTRVKWVCDIKEGIRSQCLREPKVQKANNQYWNNVALKLNARLGGANALVDSPALRDLQSKPFMIMGADVAHPSPGTARPSVSSLVWSHDQHGAAYCATTRLQEPRTEIIDIENLMEMVAIAITMFGSKHKVAPASIVFYRDGVSEGEFHQVQKCEIKAVENAIDDVWKKRDIKEAKPKLTFVVVGKRHHVTFFPSEERNGDRSGNCRAGLVVDDKGLTNPQFPNGDFYLQSHSAIKGTSRSAHYTVLKDDVFGGNIAKLQELSFALCHIYAKATRSVSIPAPVYYADLACGRAKFHIDPSMDLDIDGSTTTGGEGFVLGAWTGAYEPINTNIRASMYFL